MTHTVWKRILCGPSVLVVLAAALASAPARGAGFGISEQSASATGRACAVTAVADTPSAIYYNPAGLGMQKGLGIEAGVTLIVPLGSHEDPATGLVTDSETSLFYPPTVYVSYRLPERIAFGLGFFVPYGLGITWPEGWTGFEKVESIELQAYFINPTVAWSPLEWLSVGAGVDIVRSIVDLRKGINFIDEHGSLHAGASAWGFGGNAGLLLRLLGGRLSFGLSYRSAVRFEFTGNADFTVPAAFALLLEDQPIETDLTLPHVLSMGIAGKPVSMLTLSADLIVTTWSTFKEFGLNFPGDMVKPESEKLSQTEPRNWRNTWALRFGAEVRPPLKWLVVRAPSGPVSSSRRGSARTSRTCTSISSSARAAARPSPPPTDARRTSSA
jgi:long-chain fatty acid transport protein